MIAKFQKVYDKKTQTYRLKKVLPFWLDLIITLVVAFGVAVGVNLFVLEPFWIPSGSMRATLEENDKIWVEKLTPHWNGIDRGDVVVFADPGGWLDGYSNPDSEPQTKGIFEFFGLGESEDVQFLVKRVIGVPGDRVQCDGSGSKIRVNGVEIDETYIYENQTPSEVPFDVEVPEGMLWVMGDNRGNSSDSRFHSMAAFQGFVPTKNVVGSVVFKFYPFDRFGFMPDYHSVFQPVPKALAPLS